MKALILDSYHKTANLKDVPIPVPKEAQILVEVKAISLNPIDPLYVAHPLASSGRTIGSDFAGVVASLGSSIPSSSNLKVGDRVSGFLQGACSANDRPGAFAQFLVTEWDLVWKIPEGITVEEAAGVSLVALTAAQGIWYRLGLSAPFPFNQAKVLEEHPDWAEHASNKESGSQNQDLTFFIYGASTSVGLYAAQMVRLSAEVSGKNVRLFGAASRGKWSLLKSAPYEYDQLVDYREEDWPEQIVRLSGREGVHYAYDCISEGTTVERVSSTLATNGRIAIVRSRAGGAWKAENLHIEPIYGAVWEGLGEEVQYQGFTIKRSPIAREFARDFFGWLNKAAGSVLKANPIRLMPGGGLERVVLDGFEVMGQRGLGRTEEWMKPVSAEKLVYQI